MTRTPEEVRQEMLDTQLDLLDGIEEALNGMEWPHPDRKAMGAVLYLAGVIEAQTRVQIAAARIAAIR